MCKRDKATSPPKPSRKVENVLFPARAAPNGRPDRDMGVSGDLANPTELRHFGEYSQGFHTIMPVIGREVQIVNNFLIKSAERC
jgi:hypothetical protein